MTDLQARISGVVLNRLADSNYGIDMIAREIADSVAEAVTAMPGIAIVDPEIAKWRQLLEDTTGAETLEEAAQWLTLSGLSINLGSYGEWGCETLECLFAELGIQPGDDFEAAVKHAAAVQAQEEE